MKRALIASIVALMLPLAGCDSKPEAPKSEPNKGLEVNAPGVQVKTGEGGTEVKTPGADVEVKPKQ